MLLPHTRVHMQTHTHYIIHAHMHQCQVKPCKTTCADHLFVQKWLFCRFWPNMCIRNDGQWKKVSRRLFGLQKAHSPTSGDGSWPHGTDGTVGEERTEGQSSKTCVCSWDMFDKEQRDLNQAQGPFWHLDAVWVSTLQKKSNLWEEKREYAQPSKAN